jgi:hypothetical protein
MALFIKEQLLASYRWKELNLCSNSSAGIIRIRFAGRDLADLLSAQEYQAPRAGTLDYLKSICLFSNMSSIVNQTALLFDALSA